MSGTAQTGAARVLEEPLRRDLIEELWPDKSLFAAVLLFLAGLVGLLTWVVDVTFGVTYANETARLFGSIPSWFVALFSALAFASAAMALRKRSTQWTLLGALFAIVSVGFAGVNIILALVALDFVRRARNEGEDRNPATRLMTADMWPDKVLAASLLFVVAGVVTIAWGLSVAFDLVTYGGYAGSRLVFGTFAVAAGLFGLLAARRLYLQESPMLALTAAVVVGAPLSLWVIGPFLAIAAAVLVFLGIREHEFGAARPAEA